MAGCLLFEFRQNTSTTPIAIGAVQAQNPSFFFWVNLNNKWYYFFRIGVHEVSIRFVPGYNTQH